MVQLTDLGKQEVKTYIREAEFITFKRGLAKMLSKKQIYKKAYDRFFGIDNARDLHICKLNFADHSVVYDILRDLYIGKLEKPATTFNKRAAEWFKANGFKVVADGVNYTISL